jgi:D-lactate dehydrogenase
MKIVSFFNLPWQQDYFRERMSEHEFVFFEEPFRDHASYGDPDAEVLSVFVGSRVDAEHMDRFPKLKAIVTRSTGFDHIDLEEAKKRGITVSNVPTYGENTVAEFAFALLLSLSRKIYSSYDRLLKEGSYSAVGLRGFDLMGKKIGVVGTGHIGRYAIKMAKGFGMEVVAFDVNEDHEYAKEMGFMYVTLEDLMSQSDIITLHVPYNTHTHHMINMDNISKIKRGAHLINTSRGQVVETAALVRALEEGIIEGAGLDVLEEEELMKDGTSILYAENPDPKRLQIVLANKYFVDHPRVIVTPHSAYSTKEAVERILNTTIENIQAVANGEPVNVVNK